MTRTCTPDTVGQITARLCSDEPLCHVGCGDIDECAANGGLNDCTNIATTGGFADDFTCSNTIGSYTCDRGTGTLTPQADDGLHPWESDGEEWSFVPGTNAAGEEILTITGIDTQTIDHELLTRASCPHRRPCKNDPVSMLKDLMPMVLSKVQLTEIRSLSLIQQTLNFL